MAMSGNVDPFAVEDPSELPDWRVPLSFMKSRHSEKIEGEPEPQDSWRMKDRVSGWRVSGSVQLFSVCIELAVHFCNEVTTSHQSRLWA